MKTTRGTFPDEHFPPNISCSPFMQLAHIMKHTNDVALPQRMRMPWWWWWIHCYTNFLFKSGMRTKIVEDARKNNDNSSASAPVWNYFGEAHCRKAFMQTTPMVMHSCCLHRSQMRALLWHLDDSDAPLCIQPHSPQLFMALCTVIFVCPHHASAKGSTHTLLTFPAANIFRR